LSNRAPWGVQAVWQRWGWLYHGGGTWHSDEEPWTIPLFWRIEHDA